MCIIFPCFDNLSEEEEAERIIRFTISTKKIPLRTTPRLKLVSFGSNLEIYSDQSSAVITFNLSVTDFTDIDTKNEKNDHF